MNIGRRTRERIVLHPMMSFIILIAVVIVLSGILDLFDASVTYNSINAKTGAYESTLVTVESLFNLSGLKYIFSSTVSNFVSFAPLSMLLIILIGIGIMDESGFLDSFFFVLTKKLPKTVVTYIITLICIFCSVTGDIAYVVFIPLTALLFKYGRRNPIVGIINAFASVGLGYGLHFVLSSLDSSLLDITQKSANIISSTYVVSEHPFLIIELLAVIVGSVIITYITEKVTAPRLGKYEEQSEEIIEDKESLTRRELRGLLFALGGAILYGIIFIWNIIPHMPLGGNLLDYSQARYIEMLFGSQSFFNSGFVFIITILFILVGLLYGLGARTISNHRDICNFLSHSLDEIGKVIILILFASILVSLLKYTNIGDLFTGLMANLVANSQFTGIPLIILVLFVGLLTTFMLPSMVSRWNILSGSLVPTMMSAGLSPEFAQLIFTVGGSASYILTPAMAYFVIYNAYIEKYDKDGTGMMKCLSYCLPYSAALFFMWFVLLLLWFVTGLPIGIGVSTVL
ncbi:MAG TPA: AbgT family transporter [Bacilli bacterium]|nr:AbgT family transporter [Bacilli bacterium]HPZ23691.1 AbgT family transporter [Bacilli bacterium]HQC83357.1 AbgT family transporter [Bacilli bacterium]